MSLINDALKRAKVAQQQVSAPPPDLPLRPAEPSQQHARHNLGLLLPVALALVALLALFLVWRWAQTRQAAAPAEVAARAATPAVPAQSDWSAQPPSAPAPAAAPTAEPAVSLAPELTTSPFATAQETNSGPTDPAAPPKPTPLRLQGILFNPRRPFAMINGKTVCVGDRVGDQRVMAIDRESATLVGSGQTNVLMLAD